MKSLLITEQEKEKILSLYGLNKDNIFEQNKEQNKSECFVVKITHPFDVNETEKSQNTTNFINEIINSINNNENKLYSQYLKNDELEISKIILEGCASNYYDGVVKPDYNNEYKPYASGGTTNYPGDYEKNLKLATDRATNTFNILFKELPNYNLPFKIGLKPTIFGRVVNTGGKVDDQRDTKIYPNPGQVVIARITVCKVTRRVKPQLTEKDVFKVVPKTIDELKKLGKEGFIITGSYYCNGKNSENRNATKDLWNPSDGGGCTQSLLNADKNKLYTDIPHISAFEIKYNLNVSGNKYVVPVVRWKFYWKEDNNKVNKIVRVDQQQIDHRYDPNNLFPTKTVDINDEYFRLCLRGGDPNKPEKIYDTFIKKFI